MTKQKPDWEVLQIGIDVPREELNKRIDKRVDDRFEQGMLEEVAGLIKSGVDPEWLLRLGLEYRIIGNYILSHGVIPDLIRDPGLDSRLRGNDKNTNTEQYGSEFELMKNQLKLRSHQYAKRQVTWFKRFPEVVWLSEYREIEKRAKGFLKK